MHLILRPLIIIPLSLLLLCSSTQAPLSPNITIDNPHFPGSTAFLSQSQVNLKTTLPIIYRDLKIPKSQQLKKIILKVKDMKGVAHAEWQSSTIHLSGNWITDHPDDFGMVIHETFHLIQAYPKYQPVWLTEGIADYVRYFIFEPKIGKAYRPKASYKKGYLPAAAFLAWVTNKYNPELIIELNQAKHKGSYTPEIFKKLTKKTLDELWVEYSQEFKI